MRLPVRPLAVRSSRLFPARAGTVALATAALAALGVPAALPAAAAPPGPPAASAPIATRLASAEAQLGALNRTIERAVEQYDAARIALVNAQRRAVIANRQAEAARREYAVKRAELTAYAVAAYQGEVASPLLVVVNSSPAKYLDRLSMLDAVARTQSDVVRVVNAARLRSERAQRTAQAAVAAATATAARIGRTRTAIERSIATQRAVIGALRAEQARLAALAAAQRAAAARAAAAQRARALAAAAQAARAAAQINRVLTGGATVTHPVTPPVLPPSSGRGAIAVQAAYSQLGKPYVFGAAGPNAYDCSGLTMWAWAHAGVALPHSAAAQFGSGPQVPRSALQPGDLLFFYTPIDHVAIYIGNGMMIDAPHTGTVVSIQPVYWNVYVGAVRPG